jgi:uncharacterized protein YdhG (YjbR/CyaY superfamily)
MDGLSSRGSPKTIDEYIVAFPPEVRTLLDKMRKVIHEEAPQAEEAIRYGMPTFRLNGNLVHFAAARHHLGFYPTPSAIIAFGKELEPYTTSKGAVQFPYERPIPFDLVRRMVRFQVKESENKAKR